MKKKIVELDKFIFKRIVDYKIMSRNEIDDNNYMVQRQLINELKVIRDKITELFGREEK